MKRSTKSKNKPSQLALVGSSSVPPGDTPAREFAIKLRAIHSADETAKVIRCNTAEEALRQALGTEVSNLVEPVLQWDGVQRLVALDLDRPEGAERVKDHVIPSLFPEYLPQPTAAWPTHGGGLRAVFSEVDDTSAIALAGAWYALAPLQQLETFSVEVKSDTRHPGAPRGQEHCGRVFSKVTSARLSFPDEMIERDIEGPEVQRWLLERGLTPGRHDLGLCPWCGPRGSGGNPGLMVDQLGVSCHRCKTRRSWGQLVPGGSWASSLKSAARNFVHLPHQRFVLMAARPQTPASLMGPTWEFMLRTANADRLKADEDGSLEERIRDASAETFDIVRSQSGAWLGAATLLPRTVTAGHTLRRLPWALSLPRVDQAASAEPLPGFVNVTAIPYSAVLAPYKEPPPGVLVRRPPRPKEPPAVELGRQPPDPGDVELAFQQIQAALPGFNRGYVRGLLVALLAAQHATGTPPVLVVTGPTGVGKTAHARLAAGMVGRTLADISLRKPDDVLRQVGLALERGDSPLCFDEVGRAKQVFEGLQAILKLNSEVSYRALYANEQTIAVDAPVVLSGSTLPRAISTSSELARRCVGYDLHERADDWRRQGDIAFLRRNPELRYYLDIVTASVWWRLAQLGPNPDWRTLCLTEYGAIPLEELDSDGLSSEGRAAAIRTLYEAFRTAPPNRFSAPQSFGGRVGWLICKEHSTEMATLSGLVDMENQRGQYADISELKRMNLEPILGFGTPRLRLLLHRRGDTWLVKFEQRGVMKGTGLTPAQLPLAGNPACGTSVTCATGATASAGETVL